MQYPNVKHSAKKNRLLLSTGDSLAEIAHQVGYDSGLGDLFSTSDANLLDFEERWGSMRSRILGCTDLPTLERWLRRTMSATSAAELTTES